jgi:hypothetical protein
MRGMDGLRALAKEATERGRAGLDATLDGVRAVDRDGRVEALVRAAVAQHSATADAGRARRERVLAWVGGTTAGAAIGQGVRTVGRHTQRIPLLSAPADLCAERNGIDTLMAAVRADPRDPLAHLWLGEALLTMQRDVRLLDLARTALNPQGAVLREALKTAAALGTPSSDPALQVLGSAEQLAALRLGAKPRDAVALHVIARVRLATGRPEDALQPAKLAVAAGGGEQARALVTLARVYFTLGRDAAAANVARKGIDTGCSLGWQVLAELLYRDSASGDGHDDTGSPRHREYVTLRSRVDDADRRAYHGVHRNAAEVARAVLDTHLGRARAIGASVGRSRARPGSGLPR